MPWDDSSPWLFVLTLAWSRRAHAEIVTDQKVATWLGSPGSYGKPPWG